MSSAPVDQLDTVKQIKSRALGLLDICKENSDYSEIVAILEELRLKENKFKALFPSFKLDSGELDEVSARLDKIEARINPAPQ